MGIVYTEITLKNAGDISKAEDGIIKEEAVRQVKVRAMVDTGASTLIINNELCQKLGLKIKKTWDVMLAGGAQASAKVTSPVEVCWQDRSTTCESIVLADEKDVLLGAIPLEGMDLMVHPTSREVVGVHGARKIFIVK